MSEAPDVFDELFALLTPQRLLRDPRATGAGVRVCVIDSGVERSLLEQRARDRGHPPPSLAGGIFTRDRAEPPSTATSAGAGTSVRTRERRPSR